MALTGSQTKSVDTGTDGRYSFSSLDAGGSYTVTPSLANYTFSPTSQTFNALAANQTADFSATPNHHAIRGRVKRANGTGIPGVAVALSGSQSATGHAP